MNEHRRNDRDILRYTDVEYTPEGYENVYRWGDFLEIAGGDARYAAMLINRTASGEPEEGLHPETLVDQDIRDGEAFMLAGRPIVPEDDILYTMMEPVCGEWKSDRIDLYTPQDCFGFSDPFGGRIEYTEKKPEIAVAVKPDPVELGHRAAVAAGSTAGDCARRAGIKQ